MPLWPEFCGGMYQTRSSIIGSDEAINVYLETREVPGSPKQVTLYGTPGQKLETTLGTSRSRGWFTQDGRTWCVFGNTLYERTASATFASRGTIPDDGLNVFFASNGIAGDQLAISGGGQINVLNLVTNVVTTAVLPFANPVTIVFQDGFGLVNQKDTPTVWFSHLEDFTTWDALDFFTRSTTSDNVIGLAITRDRLLVFGSKVVSLYYDSGDALNPWVPYPGTSSQVGALSAYAINVYNDVAFWLAQSARGEPKICSTRTDMQVQTISTPPIADALAAATSFSTAEILIYSQVGHAFVVYTNPTCTQPVKTRVWDILENRWHSRANVDPTTGDYLRWAPAGGITVTGGTVLTGDSSTGAVYQLDLTTYTDNGKILKRERVAPYPSAENQWGFINSIELGMQAGVGPTGASSSTPAVVELQISRDGSNTFTSAGVRGLGALGNYLARCIWRPLGRSRMDRLVIRIVQTVAAPCVWGPGLWLDVTPGTNQL